MEIPRKKLRLDGADYGRYGYYFITITTYKRQRLFGNISVNPNKWFNESGEYQYSYVIDNDDNILTPVGATPCGSPRVLQMIEYWIHRIPTKFVNTYIDYYVIMPDHIHLIIEISDKTHGLPRGVAPTDEYSKSNTDLEDTLLLLKTPNIEKILDWFKTMTTNEYIHLVKEGILPPFDHHVWQRGYYDHVIRNRDDLYECRKYIKNNPARWLNENK